MLKTDSLHAHILHNIVLDTQIHDCVDPYLIFSVIHSDEKN